VRKMLLLLVPVLALAPAMARGIELADLFLTPDQQAARLERAGQHAEAAGRYADPFRQGVAWYRAGEFDKAAEAFARVPTAEAGFNRGNALLLRGKYDEAIASFGRALELRPGWREAEDNRSLAVARKARLAPPEDDAGGTGGQLAPDQIVIGDGRKGGTDTQEVDATAGEPASDADLRALWLRQVETRPADFLRAKFAYQQASGAGQGP
jgi:Ca-activated chloride channel family protein